MNASDYYKTLSDLLSELNSLAGKISIEDNPMERDRYRREYTQKYHQTENVLFDLNIELISREE